ncbi:MAG: DUF551 domain-containing protein [Spirochaetales bacterium]|jgi:hypothetical protein|nr:DUF551 domain-containing protein [Spirochaetales bacterium]
MNWISVQDEPIMKGNVIVFAPNGKNQTKDLVIQAYSFGNDYVNTGHHNNRLYGVTHWMELPLPPLNPIEEE